MNSSIARQDASLAEQITAKEAELTQAREAMVANFERHAGSSKLRGKQHGIRIDAQIRRGANLGATVTSLERELEGLRRQAARPVAPALDLSKLPTARFIRTKVGWYEVVKVNKVSVKVKTDPGWDDLVKISKIVEIR